MLATVSAIRGEGMVMELRYTDLEERARTRLLYASSAAEQATCEEELREAQQVGGGWKADIAGARGRGWGDGQQSECNIGRESRR